ncbi:Esterase FE4 [Armadillidium vulgare]|nr:Esterase FE4 [Armadillidium vulgare]
MKGLLATLFFFLIFSSSLAKNISEEPPLIKVKQGSIKGIKEVSLHGKKFDSYYNIPYAEPPINHLRFKDPVPKSSWKGVHDGSKKPQMCPFPLYYDALTAGDSGNMKIYGDEDCLILNVFTPKSRIQKSNIPVMFYIHGGGYYQGSAFEYEPYFLMDEDIVLVVIQYRLGVLGFLSTEDDVLPGNMGLKDQQLALKWVNENIDCFGGDPNQVTIFGGSAGAASVNLQMLSPGSKGLFQGAIMQGGGALCSFSYQTDSLKYAKITGDHFNCSLDKGTQNYVECMRSIEPFAIKPKILDDLNNNFENSLPIVVSKSLFTYWENFIEGPDVDIYLYEMDHFGAVSDSAAIPGYDRHNWITHQDSIYYLFGTGGPRFYAPITEESDIKVRNFYVKAWTNFAKYG